jgi:hypothetical protein
VSHSSHPDGHVQRLGAGTPIVFDCIRAGEPESLELDIWYANRHLPRTEAWALRRYAAPAHASYLYIQEWSHRELPVQASAPLPDPLPRALREHLRCIGHPLGEARRRDSGPQALNAPYAYPVFFEVPPEWRTQFNDWYEREHVPMLLECPQWLMCRRFELQALAGCPWTHMALHYLSDLRALSSPQRDAARSTPWRRELEQQDWFRYTHRLGLRLA